MERKNGNLKERYQANLHIVDKHILKFYLGISGQFRTTKYNESIKKEIDLRPIIRAVVEKHRYQNLIINETQFVHDFYDAVMREISEKLRNYIDITLPKKGFNQTVTGKIKDACLRLDTALRLRFEYNYRYPHEVDPLAASNSYAIIYQVPFNGFDRLDRENLYATRRGEYAPLMATKAVEWFADYVYALRNALFHEIISPLDEEWQAIFKSAYLLLKQVSDICISCISQIEEFPQTQENAVFEYAEKHKSECFDPLADHVELLDFPKMVLSDWKVEKGKITLRGWFSATLKLQQGDAEAIENGTGSVMLNDFTGADQVYIACGYTDLRKGIDGLARLVQQQFELDPFTNTLFLFCGRRRDRIKGLYWEKDGFILLYKRLEQGAYQWPRSGSEVKTLLEPALSTLQTVMEDEEIPAQARITAARSIIDYSMRLTEQNDIMRQLDELEAWRREQEQR